MNSYSFKNVPLCLAFDPPQSPWLDAYDGKPKQLRRLRYFHPKFLRDFPGDMSCIKRKKEPKRNRKTATTATAVTSEYIQQPQSLVHNKSPVQNQTSFRLGAMDRDVVVFDRSTTDSAPLAMPYFLPFAQVQEFMTGFDRLHSNLHMFDPGAEKKLPREPDELDSLTFYYQEKTVHIESPQDPKAMFTTTPIPFNPRHASVRTIWDECRTGVYPAIENPSGSEQWEEMPRVIQTYVSSMTNIAAFIQKTTKEVYGVQDDVLSGESKYCNDIMAQIDSQLIVVSQHSISTIERLLDRMKFRMKI